MNGLKQMKKNGGFLNIRFIRSKIYDYIREKYDMEKVI